ncbi:MAG: GLPGLI family protein [Tannerella sp.]|jgi:GLPGLI family protein|nr:GLPGLI family protein [Tannerella sp.]
MNKIYLATIFLLVFGSNLFAQQFNYRHNIENIEKYRVLDSAYMKCTYTLIYLKDSTKPADKSKDRQILLIGKDISKYYSQYALDYKLYIMELSKKAENLPNTSEMGAWSFEVFKNYPKEKMTVTDIAAILSGNFYYEEEMPVFKWNFSAIEQKTILDYKCNKATVSFRGRDFVAWYAPEIPVDNGPWKFGGLPGLILRLEDAKGNFIYECIGLENLKQKEPIKYYLVQYQKVSRQDLWKLYRCFHDDFKSYWESIGIKVHLIEENGKRVEVKLPYNPIELE